MVGNVDFIFPKLYPFVNSVSCARGKTFTLFELPGIKKIDPVGAKFVMC